jgi:hypothetical protein
MCARIVKHGQQAGIIGTAAATAICALFAVTQNHELSTDPISHSAPRVQLDGDMGSSTSTPYLWKKLSNTTPSDPFLKGSYP